ncbi:hypothetical protein AM391_RS21385 [Kluyvera ascorbata]|nr:hypothetical protein [Kluyvera ascorbata]
MSNKSEYGAFDNNFGHNVITIGDTGAGKTFFLSDFLRLNPTIDVTTKIVGEEDGPEQENL